MSYVFSDDNEYERRVFSDDDVCERRVFSDDDVCERRVFSDDVCERRVFSDDSEHLPSVTARLAWVRRTLQGPGERWSMVGAWLGLLRSSRICYTHN